ncbi:MAG: type II secretion system protein [Acidobacteriota bacterium]|nr:MAG: type II secretion system protein [Acidobacteriota bacterium]
MRRLMLALAVLGMGSPPVVAISFYFSPDVATKDSSGMTALDFLAWDIVRDDSGAYSVAVTLPSGTPIDAVFRMNVGDWLISFEAPTDLGGATYEPRDVVRFDGLAYSLMFDGSARGVPITSSVDAVLLVGGDDGDIVLSFDVPTTIGASTYEPADLVRYDSATGFSLFFDASVATPPVPITSNVTGADTRHGLTILTFDVPTTLGATTYLPGELVSWDSSLPGFASFFSSAGWPLSSRVDGLAFLAAPGAIPPTMTVAMSMITAGDLTISWQASCSVGGEDYGVYEGSIGTWYSHTTIDCADAGGDRTEEITPGTSDHYYLVVPMNPNDEGSYGTDSAAAERPAGSPSVCRTTQELEPCPWRRRTGLLHRCPHPAASDEDRAPGAEIRLPASGDGHDRLSVGHASLVVSEFRLPSPADDRFDSSPTLALPRDGSRHEVCNASLMTAPECRSGMLGLGPAERALTSAVERRAAFGTGKGGSMSRAAGTGDETGSVNERSGRRGPLAEACPKRARSHSRRCAGFTLVELLIGVALIGILATVAMSSSLNGLQRSRQMSTMASLHSLGTVIESYSIDNARYPTASNITELIDSIVPVYMKSSPS